MLKNSFLKIKIILPISFFILFMAGCAPQKEPMIKQDFSGHIHLSKEEAMPANPYKNPYDARSYPNKLEIFKGDKKICTIQSEGFKIERWGFIDKGNYVVIRSIGKDKQIILELFKTKTCKRVDKIKVSNPKKDEIPLWANSVKE